jgi:NAD(P)-dependent dehydrogenase (short-subunit alcohol dehydrogenase family)
VARFTGKVAVVTGASKRIGADAASSLDATVVAAVVGSERFVTRTTYMAGDAFSFADISRSPSRCS